MPIKGMTGRYEPGSEQERAHRILKNHDVKVDHVYDVGRLESGLEEVTFVSERRAQTAWVEDGRVVHVLDGWDVLPPKPASEGWRSF